MTKLTLVIQAPLMETYASHLYMHRILSKCQEPSPHQVERVVLIGPAAVLAAKEKFVDQCWKQKPCAHEEPVYPEYYGEEGDPRFLDDDFLDFEELEVDGKAEAKFLAESDALLSAEMNDWQSGLDLNGDDAVADDDEAEEEQEQRKHLVNDRCGNVAFLNDNEFLFTAENSRRHRPFDLSLDLKTYRDEHQAYNTLTKSLGCEVLVHDVAAKHYHLDPQTMRSGWKLISTTELVKLLVADRKQGINGEEHRVILWHIRQLNKSIDPVLQASVTSMRFTPAETAMSLVTSKQPEPELTVFLSFPQDPADGVASVLAAETPQQIADYKEAVRWEQWWRIFYALLLVYKASKAGIKVQACITTSVKSQLESDELQFLQSELSFPKELRERFVQAEQQGVPFFFSGPNSFYQVIKKQMPTLNITKVPEKQVRALLRYPNAPLLVF